MAGGVLKTFGVLFLVGGLLLALAGLGAAGFGYFDQEQHKEDAGPLGAGEDPERTDQNEMLLMGGAVAAVVGLLGLILGMVFLAAGGSRAADRRHQELLEQTGRQTPAAAAAVTDPAADAQIRADASPAQDARPAPARLRRAAPILGVAALAVVAVLVMVFAAGGPMGNGQEGTNDGPGGSTEIDSQHYDRVIPATVTVLGSSNTPESTTHEFTAPAKTDVVRANVTWTAVQGGTESIQFSLEVLVDGAWQEVGSQTGTAPLMVEAGDDDAPYDFSEASMRFRAFPGEDGVNQEQPYSVTLTFYRR